MNRHRGRRLISWIACLAILAAGFMPSLTYALAAHSGAHGAHGAMPSGIHEFCSTATASQPTPAPAHGLNHGAHCPFCLLHLDAAAPPPSAAGVIPVAPLPRPHPHAFVQARASRSVWLAAQPRAPPRSV